MKLNELSAIYNFKGCKVSLPISEVGLDGYSVCFELDIAKQNEDLKEKCGNASRLSVLADFEQCTEFSAVGGSTGMVIAHAKRCGGNAMDIEALDGRYDTEEVRVTDNYGVVINLVAKPDESVLKYAEITFKAQSVTVRSETAWVLID